MGASSVDEEDAYIKATKVLDGLSVEDRDKYVFDVLAVFSATVDIITKEKNKIKQLKKCSNLSKELSGEKGQEIVVCALYAIKKNYRPLFVSLLKAVTGIQKDVMMPE